MKYRILIIIGVSLLAAFSAVASVAAQSSDTIMTDDHIQRIKQNCKTATQTIQQVHTNDLPLRVNQGQLYESISNKLMAPLNSRLTVNKLDASSLVKITARYDKALTDFRENYKRYDNHMSSVLAIDCMKQPVRFYDSVAEARKLRGIVHSDVVTLHCLINDYGGAFTSFRTQFDEGRVKGEE